MAKVIRVNHISFAVGNLEEAIRNAEQYLGAEMIMKFEETLLHYIGAALQMGETTITFIQGTDPNDFVTKFVKEKGAGVQHLGLEIDNLEEFVKELEAKGVRVDKGHMKDKNFAEALVGTKVGYGTVLQLMQWKLGEYEGITPEGKERMRRKYKEVPGCKLLA